MDIDSVIAKQKLLDFDKKYLVAVSGGADSSVLLHVLWHLGYCVEVAHCNFHLRGEESDQDARFVRSICESYGVVYHEQDFDTLAYAKAQKVSIEMAARALRYEWFEQMRVGRGCDYIVIAHHSDDNVETFFLNLIRGSGLQGLSGMRLERQTILRPLLGVSRKDILSYAESHGLKYRIDSSNKEQVYLRNRLRLDIIPRMKLINPSLDETIQDTQERLREANELLQWSQHWISEQVCHTEKGCMVIDLEKLRSYPGNRTLLYAWLSPLGCNGEMISELLMCSPSSSGQRFVLNDFLSVHSRGKLYVNMEHEIPDLDEVSITADAGIFGRSMMFEQLFIDRPLENEIVRSRNVATLDLDLLHYPLLLRRWRQGDRFYPFGMKGMKKLSDYITDLKLTPQQKHDVYVLESSGEIVWVVGYRIDQRFAIGNETRRCAVLTLLS